jgi:NitT/TauT family transport system permease protein
MNALAKPSKWEKLFWPLVATLLLLAVWHFAVAWSGTRVFPSPLDVKRGIAELIHKKILWNDILDSLRRVAIGFGAAALIGIPFGLTLGWYAGAYQVLNPALQLVRPISPIAWIPLVIIFFGVGDHAATVLIFLGAFFPIVIASIDGVSNVPAVLRKAGQNFGLGPGTLLMRVIFPAALPRIIVGLRISLGIAWLVVVAAEMVAVDSGLGYLIIDARNSGKRYDLVVAAMLIIGIIGLLLDTAMRSLERFDSIRWGFRHES